VTILCSRCFAHCRSLEQILFPFPASLLAIEESAVKNSSLRFLRNPVRARHIDALAFIGLDSIVIELIGSSEDVHYQCAGPFLYKSTRLVRLLSSSTAFVLIPSSISVIGPHCFAFCSHLESIHFDEPSSLKRIEAYAFERSSLKSIVIPTSVE
jgi:hypothetical protein